MQRFQTAFYEPLVSDWSNFGQWTDSGSKTATQRANGIWKKILQEFEAPVLEETRHEELQAFIERRSAEGGAPIA
jgi:trimethylamine--corrinoid protein Co-methyltransferase